MTKYEKKMLVLFTRYLLDLSKQQHSILYNLDLECIEIIKRKLN